MERHNVGIAYPAISEKDLIKFNLPVSQKQIEATSDLASQTGRAVEELHRTLAALDDALEAIGPELSR